ncbi:MAG: hypothetical protein KJ779_07845 [Firmicutes bacterium]|nr:hypothetical protein [Bacillota bacterium]
MSDYQNAFEESIDLAKKALKEGDYILAEEKIRKAMNENPHSPISHNLYGILEELLKEENLAHKHYRAAYALDPTYKPAIRNLERTAAFDARKNNMHIDFGDEPVEEEEDLYTIEYDKNHVGHLRKKERK